VSCRSQTTLFHRHAAASLCPSYLHFTAPFQGFTGVLATDVRLIASEAVFINPLRQWCAAAAAAKEFVVGRLLNSATFFPNWQRPNHVWVFLKPSSARQKNK
jgi:hypothetical protein